MVQTPGQTSPTKRNMRNISPEQITGKNSDQK